MLTRGAWLNMYGLLQLGDQCRRNRFVRMQVADHIAFLNLITILLNKLNTSMMIDGILFLLSSGTCDHRCSADCFSINPVDEAAAERFDFELGGGAEYPMLIFKYIQVSAECLNILGKLVIG